MVAADQRIAKYQRKIERYLAREEVRIGQVKAKNTQMWERIRELKKKKAQLHKQAGACSSAISHIKRRILKRLRGMKVNTAPIKDINDQVELRKRTIRALMMEKYMLKTGRIFRRRLDDL